MATAVEAVEARRQTKDGGYVCFSNVHSVVTAHNDRPLRDATNNSFMSMPDGKPVYAIGRLLGEGGISQVAGPDFMIEFLVHAPKARHYFYGATEETLAKLAEALKGRVAGLNIVGMYSPPFRVLSPEEDNEIVKSIQEAQPDYIWVGIGAPKQEYWMVKHWDALKPAILFGVGAAFDFHAGVKSRAPKWMQSIGLEWLFRLGSEPRRLWRRYLVTNSLFILLAMRDLLSKHLFIRTK